VAQLCSPTAPILICSLTCLIVHKCCRSDLARRRPSRDQELSGETCCDVAASANKITDGQAALKFQFP
jgi:hypothetical protein